MKKWMLLFVFISFYAQSIAQDFENAALHVGTGALIGAAGGYAAYELSNQSRGWTWVGAVGSSLAAGLVKESYGQSRGHLYEIDDVLYTALGGLVSGLALDLLLPNRRTESRGRGKNYGCLVINTSKAKPFILSDFGDDGSQNLKANLQAHYIVNAGL